MHVGLAGVPPRTVDLLDFVVVGGGISGLATAWSLQNAGHRVTVLEQQSASVMAKCREAIRSTPSMTQILNDWGIGDRVAKISTPIDKIAFHDGPTGRELGLVPFSGKVRESLHANYLCVQYGELFTIFRDLAEEAGVKLYFNAKVVSIDPSRPSVTCEDGRQWTADVVVGADGTESIVRPIVLGPSMPEPECDDRFTVCLLLPAHIARQDEELAELLDARSWTGWFGNDCCMHGILTGPGPNHDYAVVAIIMIQNNDDLEEFPLSRQSLRVDQYEPRAQKLLTMSEQLSKVVFEHYEPFETWAHESGKVVLLGEAAHPMIPSGSHNMYPCIEDAMTLSTLFSLPATKSQTPMLLNVYEELRQPRCASVQRYALRKREVITLPRGAAQQRRDSHIQDQFACFKEDELSDDFLYKTYTGLIQVYGFDARETVQDWWVKWGKTVLNRSPEDEEDDEEDEVEVVRGPVLVDANVAGRGLKYPIISDPLMGEDEYVVRQAETDRLYSMGALYYLRLDLYFTLTRYYFGSE